MKTNFGLNNEDKIFVHDKNISWIVRLLILTSLPVFSIWYSLLLLTYRFKHKQTQKKHFFSICAIFKDESLILKEWIEYNLLIGVDHFYLYNNNSTDNYNDILKPYIDKDIVTLIEWNFPPPSQFPAYEHFFKTYWSDTKWVAFIDLDEFICPFRDVTITDWIKSYDKYGSVVVYWKQFGTSGKLYNDNSLLITEQYTICWEKYFSIGKTFVNTDYDVLDFSAKNLHAMATNITLFGIVFSIPPVNEFKKFIKYKSNRIGLLRDKNEFSIQINHYGTKSYSNYMFNKRVRGDVNNHVRDLETFFWAEQYNTSTDHKIFRFMTELKIKMGQAEDVQKLIDK